MKPPVTYAEWSALLTSLRKISDNDEEILCMLEQGSIEWTAGVGEKIGSLSLKVIENRLQSTSELLLTELKRLEGEEAALIKALINTRKRFSFVHRFCQIKAFPDEVKDILLEVLNQFVNDSQNALVASTRHDRSGRLAYLVKSNSLLDYRQAEAPSPSPNNPVNYGNGKTTNRRRVLFR
ncbi:hypothetical protein [Paenibacillus sp. GCM10027626]|uniref:hypothetical protein n=1 Tax=Paenibacillus sp. GCM10027626 TaxID=3273411 RepID=UPI00362AAA24